MTWVPARVAGIVRETATATTLQLEIPGWTGSAAGQHVDIRLTADDGYTAVRSYSLASAPGAALAEVTIEELPGGEVSPYLVHVLGIGDLVEVRGPVGGYFVWRSSETRPVQLVAGGSGIVPLIAMLRAHRETAAATPMRLLYSVRSPADVYYRDEIASLAATGRVDLVFTREAPDGTAGRITTERLGAAVLPPSGTLAYVCGPTGFVETIATWMVDLGYDPGLVRTERFGGV